MGFGDWRVGMRSGGAAMQMTLGDVIQKMNDEGVESVDAMVRALSGDTQELIEALCTSREILMSDQNAAEQFHVLLGVLGFGVAIGYYRALSMYDELLGMSQVVRDRREGKEPC